MIGANSVVTHDLEPFSIVAGAPARTIGQVRYGPGAVAARASVAPDRLGLAGG